MALDDFESSESDLDLDEDLFDFPRVDRESGELKEEGFPQDVVDAAAALQDELDSQAQVPGVFEMSHDELGLDLDLDDLLAEDDMGLVGSVLDAEDQAAKPKEAAPQVAKPKEKETPRPEPTQAPVATPVPSAPRTPAPEPVAVAAQSSWKASLPLISAILLLNLVLLTLGLVAISSVSSSVDGFASRLADVASELRSANTSQPVEVVLKAPVTSEPAPVEEPATSTPRLKLPPFARGEITAARDAMERGEYQNARRRLFRLLATIDDPLAEDAPEAEEQANLLIAETYVLEADSMNRSEG